MKPKENPVTEPPSGALEMEHLPIADLSEAVSQAEMDPSIPDVCAPPPNRFVQIEPQGRDRRRWKRFTIDGAIVMVPQTSIWRLGKTAYVKLGPIKNIGMKGLAMHYVEKNEKMLSKATTISIMFPGEGIIVDKIPFRIVGNSRVAELPGAKEVRNLSIAFERLLPMQKLQLEVFIDNYGNELLDK